MKEGLKFLKYSVIKRIQWNKIIEINLIIFAKKNAVLSWEWTRVIVCIGGCHSVPGFQELSNMIIAFPMMQALLKSMAWSWDHAWDHA